MKHFILSGPISSLITLQRAAMDDEDSPHGGAAHDIATGAIEGGVGAIATDALIHQATEGSGGFGARMKAAGGDIAKGFTKGERPKLYKKIGIGAAVGAGATGLIGALIAGGKKTKKAVGDARQRFREKDANSDRTAQGFNMEAFRQEMIELAAGDMLLKRMAESKGAVQFPMRETEALVGAARKNVPQLASGLSAAGRNAGPAGMQGIRDSMAQQAKAARKQGLLGAMDRVKLKSNIEAGAPNIPAKKFSSSDLEAGMIKKSALGLKGAADGEDTAVKKSRLGVSAPLTPMATNMANAYMGGPNVKRNSAKQPAYTGYEYDAIHECIVELSRYDDVLSQREREDKAMLAVHRYTHKANDADKDRGAKTSRNAGILGALAGAAIPSKKVGALKRAAIGGAAGFAGVKAIRAGTNVDDYGDRSWEARRAESYPGALATGVLAAGMIARRKGIKDGLEQVGKGFSDTFKASSEKSRAATHAILKRFIK